MGNEESAQRARLSYEEINGSNCPDHTNSARIAGKRRKFYTRTSGNTLGAHREFIQSLEAGGATEVTSPEESDLTIVFCPISSRIGIDIKEALSDTTGSNQVILVVMHHTFDPDCFITSSDPQVRGCNPGNVLLTVDCLFHETEGFMKCRSNEEALSAVYKQMDLKKTGVSRLRWLLVGTIFTIIVLLLLLLAIFITDCENHKVNCPFI